MKCTTTLLLLSVAPTVCNAFVAPPVVPLSSCTVLAAEAAGTGANNKVSKENDPDKHKLQQVFPSYTKPDPYAPLGKVGDVPEDKHKLTAVFPDFTKPDPKGPLGKVGETRQKGIKPVFPDYAKPDPAGPLGKVGDVPADKHKLTQVFPPFGNPESKPNLGQVGDSPNKKGLDQIYPTW